MYNILTTTTMAKYYMEEVFSLKDGGYDFAPFEYEDDPFEYEDDEEVKEAFSDYEYIETTDVWHSDLQKDVHTLIFNISKGKKEELWGVFKQ